MYVAKIIEWVSYARSHFQEIFVQLTIKSKINVHTVFASILQTVVNTIWLFLDPECV